MQPIPGVAVTLVNPVSSIAYSAMTPGCLAGDFPRDDITLDLVRLCCSAGVRFVRAEMTGLDRSAARVELGDRPDLRYDVLSLGLGSVPVCPAKTEPMVKSIPMRPLHRLIEAIDRIPSPLQFSPNGSVAPPRLVVVGGGASGCELAAALRHRLPGWQLILLQGAKRLLPNFPRAAGELFRQALETAGVPVELQARVHSAEGSELLLEDGRRLPCDVVVWATHAAPPSILRGCGLDLDDLGFLLVRSTLQSQTDPAIFGTGDCIHLVEHPKLPKNGVHAVRQGRVLYDNVEAYLRGGPLRPFRPQTFTLALLNTSDGEAILTYGPLVWKAAWARRLKDRIDRTWVASFEPPAPAEEASAQPTMRCGGCASKVPGDVLASALRRLPPTSDSRVVIGREASEDAAVFRTGDGALEVQTVDYFRSFVDDPYLFGRIAALHALSDLHAMNARPFAALAIATLPFARGPIQEAMLHELLAGAQRTFEAESVVLAGGHTTEGVELALGFSVTGRAEEGQLFRKNALRAGDCLILTRPIGSGALLAAWMQGCCRADWFDALIDGLLISNASAPPILARHGVAACTDVTGFGLAGHLLEMLDASGLAARLTAPPPLYAGFQEVVRSGIVSTLHADNARLACRVVGERVGHPEMAWLFDPQTAGGLLLGVCAAQVDALLTDLWTVYPFASVIGEVFAGQPGELRVEFA
jgi:selenide,water dikinase